ncbi:TetR family transcriptional regulator [Nocardia sp. alder85J]|uniref:acyl-CoA-like ligand-binding transcription factor n=1 Tax=Nocardia sp. alder85J TaxID=2862949 RepID=UPI001CD7EDE6|nr:TetR family transcriptional regulator [Nocardia sp. alder85J]MCX4097235.1 TetR family transcriptional regulator [Nocardia sp. alder85J]
MSADSKAPPTQVRPGSSGMNLRERKKERTRRTIRTEAFRLFREQGYAETTVEQIAAAADISPSTFFRYFPSKEQVVLVDDLDPILIRALEEQPPELTPLEAFKRAAIATFHSMNSDEFAFEQERVRLVNTIPELHGVLIYELQRTVEMTAELVARRTGRATESLEVRAFAGAMIGALTTVFDNGQLDLERMVQILDFMQAGMPL